MNVGHGVSGDQSVCRTLLRSVQRVGANDNCGVLVDDDCLVGQRLRFRRIDIASDVMLDESFFIVRLLSAETGNEFVIENAPKRSRVVFDLGS